MGIRASGAHLTFSNRQPAGAYSGPMKRLCLLAAVAVSLASCAPGVTGPVLGRIVNGQTGQEGQVSLTRGTLRPQYDAPAAPDNAVISIGGQTYTGRTVLVESGSVRAPDSALSLNFGFGRPFDDGFFGLGGRWGYPHADRVALPRPGNLIARTAGPAPRTLTCTLTVDRYEHGVGDCLGSDGAKYALQF